MCLAIDGTTENEKLGLISIKLVLGSVCTTQNVDCITNPSRTRVIVIILHRISILRRSHTIDGTVKNINSTHSSRNATVDNAAIDCKFLLVEHINCFAQFGSKRTPVDFKIHITGRFVAAQNCIISGKHTTIDSNAT